jgi:peptidoglycan/xylan/chitin deacetylase (PgdA/CDA1 family)
MPMSAVLKTSLDVLYYTGASQALNPVLSGMGAIFMLHHVRPNGVARHGFAPNAGLEVTPHFLDAVLAHVVAKGYDLVSLSEAALRLKGEAPSERPFAVFTLDDGYEDNLVHAWPVFRRHGCPFTIFVAPAIIDGTCELWWRGLEAVIAGAPQIRGVLDGSGFEFDTLTDAGKRAAFKRLYWPVRNLPEHRQREWIREFCAHHGVDLAAQCRSEAMTWDDVRRIAADPLCTIGAHTINHYAMARLPDEEALSEAVASKSRIEEELGRTPDVFAYPYGDAGSAGQRDFDLVREAGFAAAVTTRKGLIFSAHKNHLTALPRLSLNGDYQKLRYVDVLLSGSAFALWNGFKRVAVS